MNIVQALPPEHIYRPCVEKFGVSFYKGTIFTYGDMVYAISYPEDHLLAHEEMHARQQEAMGKDVWWARYMEDDAFRFSQELEAYRAQYAFSKEKHNSKYRKYLLDHMAECLSGKMYGGLLTKEQALYEITR